MPIKSINRKWLVFSFLLLILCLSLLFIFNKPTSYAQLNKHIEAKGIQLGMNPNDVFAILGDEVDQDMCVYGYEYNYVDYGLNIGFRLDDDTVRRITLYSPKYSIFDLKVGDTLENARRVGLEQGFVEDSKVNGRMYMGNIYFTPVSKKGLHVDQLIIEVIDADIIN